MESRRKIVSRDSDSVRATDVYSLARRVRKGTQFIVSS